MSDSHRRVKLLRSSASSYARILQDRKAVAESVAAKATRDRLKEVAKPNSISGTLRKAGVALILAPDPITAVPGVVMLGASFATQGRRPLTPVSVVEEAGALLSEMSSLF